MASVTDIQRMILSQSKKKIFLTTHKGDNGCVRAAVLGATDGLVSVASFMMGRCWRAVKTDIKAMILVGFAGLVAGACSMAIGEFMSVYTQLDVEVAQLKRDKGNRDTEEESEKEQLPNPVQAALASALAFTLGAIVCSLAQLPF